LYLKCSGSLSFTEVTCGLHSYHSSEKELTAFAETLLDIYRTNEKNDRQVIYVFIYFLEILNSVVFLFDVVTLASLVPVRMFSMFAPVKCFPSLGTLYTVFRSGI